MPHAKQQNAKESVVRDGGKSQLLETTKEALGRQHTKVVQHDITTGVTLRPGSCEVEDFLSWPLRFLNHGTRKQKKKLTDQ